MPITYPITLPSTAVRRVRIAPRSAVLVTESPFTFVQQAIAHPGMVFGLTATFAPMKGQVAENLVAALVSLNGREGTFLFGDTANRTPRGVATGIPVVNGGGQVGRTLSTRGWTAGVTGILKAGDWVQLFTGANTRLFKILTDANSDGSGVAVLDVWPALGVAPADGTALVTSNAKGVFRLTDGFDWSIDERKVYDGLTLTATEARIQ